MKPPYLLAHRLRKLGHPIVARSVGGWKVAGVGGVLSVYGLARLARYLESKR